MSIGPVVATLSGRLRRPTVMRLFLLSLIAALSFSARAAEEGGGREKPRDKAALIAARDEVRGALEADPKNLAQWKRLAMIQRDLGDEAGTEAALTRAAALAPKDAGVNFMFGLLHEKRGDAAKAAAAFRVCVDNAAQEKIGRMCAKHLSRVEKP